jgi:hypothetical protein
MSKPPKKIPLLGMAQTPKHSVFQLEKKNRCVDAVRDFLHELGFASWETVRLLKPIGGGDTGKPTMKYANVLYDDKFFALQKGQFSVQVFFGKKKVIVSITTMSDVQERLKTAIIKVSAPAAPRI